AEPPAQATPAGRRAGGDRPARVPRRGRRAGRARPPPVGTGEGGLTLEGVAAGAAAPAPGRRRRLKLATPALLGLPVSWLVVFFLAPLAIVALYSVDVLALFPGPHSFALGGWYRLFHEGYIHLFSRSVKM